MIYEIKKIEKCKVSKWYSSWANYTFSTSFLKLREDEKKVLAEGSSKSKISKGIIEKLAVSMKKYPGNCFVYTDCFAPTDTERFEKKKGAVYSPESAWLFLTESEKCRNAAADGLIDHIVIRPFRRMTRPREFRLFIYNSKLKAMSQYWLTRHFRRLEGIKNDLWGKAEKFVKDTEWLLPEKNIVMDIYFTGRGKIMLIDFNPWGEPTEPLLMKNWEFNVEETHGIKIIPPPMKLEGDVNVSF